MRATTVFKGLAVATMVVLFAASASFADHDGKDHGGGGNRSFSGGDKSGGDKGSSRSFIGNSDHSSHGSSDSGRSFSRTFRGNQDSDSHSAHSSDFDRHGQSGNQAFQFKSDHSGSQFKQGNREFEVRRPTERSPKDRDLVNREFNQWRNIWNGNKGDGHDHRDWSNSWKNSDRFTVADRIRHDWHNRHDNDVPFSSSWWNGRHRGNYWGFWGDFARRDHHPYYWWSWATGPRLASWFVFGWPTPYYWDYGPGEYISYDNGAIYVNGRWYEPAPVYYDQTERLIDQAPELTAESAAKLDWQPLGVFAITPDGVGEPMVTVQLAVTKDGVIGGTAFDPKTGAAFNIKGMVDKRSQRRCGHTSMTETIGSRWKPASIT